MIFIAFECAEWWIWTARTFFYSLRKAGERRRGRHSKEIDCLQRVMSLLVRVNILIINFINYVPFHTFKLQTVTVFPFQESFDKPRHDSWYAILCYKILLIIGFNRKHSQIREESGGFNLRQGKCTEIIINSFVFLQIPWI